MLRLIANSLPKHLGSRCKGRALQGVLNCKRSSNTVPNRSEFMRSRTDRRFFHASQYHTNNVSRASNEILSSLGRSIERNARPPIAEKDDDPRLWDKETVSEWLTKFGNRSKSDANIIHEKNIVGDYLCDVTKLMAAGVDDNLAHAITMHFSQVTKPTSLYLYDAARVILDRLEKPNFEKAAQEQDLKFKHTLGPLAGESSLAFNPLKSIIDLRLMPSQLDDKVFKMIESVVINKEPHPKIIVLDAIVGAGKTSTMFNAVGRNAYLIYIQGNDGNNFTSATFHQSYDHIYNTLLAHMKMISLYERTVEELTNSTNEIVRCCQLFWLAHLITLDILQERWALTATEWLFWATSVGHEVINNILKQFLDAPKIQTGLPAVREEMIKYYTEKHSVWFALDEAQDMQQFGRKVIAAFAEETANQQMLIKERNLLHALGLYSLPNFAQRIVGGMDIQNFEEFAPSNGFKGNYVRSMDLPEFPYVGKDEVLQVIGRFIQLKNISADDIDKAKFQLQGRAQNAFRFITEVYFQAEQYVGQTMTEDLQNTIFSCALTRHRRSAETFVKLQIEYLRNEWARIHTQRIGRTFAPETNFEKVMEHVTYVGLQSWKKEWFDEKCLRDHFSLSAVQLGFCYVKRKGGSQFYAVPEPLFEDVLLKNETVQLYYFASSTGGKISCDTEDPVKVRHQNYEAITQPMINYLFEYFIKLVLEKAVRKLVTTEQTHQQAPLWVQRTMPSWPIQGTHKLIILTEADDALQKAAQAIRAGKIEIVKLLSKSYLWDVYISRGNKLSAELIDDIAGIHVDEWRITILFLLLKPLGVLYQPPSGAVPGALGFYLAFSLAVCHEEDAEKWKKNTNQFVYGQWFTDQPKSLNLQQFISRLELPRKVLGINIILPYQVQSQINAFIPLADKSTLLSDVGTCQPPKSKSKAVEYYAITVNHEQLGIVAPDLTRVLKIITPESLTLQEKLTVSN